MGGGFPLSGGAPSTDFLTIFVAGVQIGEFYWLFRVPLTHLWLDGERASPDNEHGDLVIPRVQWVLPVAWFCQSINAILTLHLECLLISFSSPRHCDAEEALKRMRLNCLRQTTREPDSTLLKLPSVLDGLEMTCGRMDAQPPLDDTRLKASSSQSTWEAIGQLFSYNNIFLSSSSSICYGPSLVFDFVKIITRNCTSD